MYRKILVGYQETEQGRDALALGRLLARATGAEMDIATAPGESPSTLARLARSTDAELLVLGSTHRGPIGKVIPGTTVERLLGEAPCAVAIAPPGFGRPVDGDLGWRPLGGGDDEDPGIRMIGVGFDGSQTALEALRMAADLAVPNGAALRVYAVAPKPVSAPGPLSSETQAQPGRAERLREQLHEAVASLPTEARALPILLWGNPATELIEATENGVDLLVLGSRGGGPFRRAVYGSVSNPVMQTARCPVLISPTGVTAPAPAST